MTPDPRLFYSLPHGLLTCFLESLEGNSLLQSQSHTDQAMFYQFLSFYLGLFARPGPIYISGSQ